MWLFSVYRVMCFFAKLSVENRSLVSAQRFIYCVNIYIIYIFNACNPGVICTAQMDSGSIKYHE